MQKYKQTSQCDFKLYFLLEKDNVKILNSVDTPPPAITQNLNVVEEEILKFFQWKKSTMYSTHTHTYIHTHTLWDFFLPKP